MNLTAKGSLQELHINTKTLILSPKDRSHCSVKRLYIENGAMDVLEKLKLYRLEYLKIREASDKLLVLFFKCAPILKELAFNGSISAKYFEFP